MTRGPPGSTTLDPPDPRTNETATFVDAWTSNANHQSAGDEGEGVGAATIRMAPRPPAFTRYRTTTRTALMAMQDLACSRSPLEMLGYLQPRDFDVHGVARVRANDLANRGTGHSMTTSDNRARPACRSRRELTRADLSRHGEGDYGSEGGTRPEPDEPAVPNWHSW